MTKRVRSKTLRKGLRTYPRRNLKVVGGRRVSDRSLPFDEITGSYKLRLIRNHIYELESMPRNELQRIDWSNAPMDKWAKKNAIWSRKLANNDNACGNNKNSKANLRDGGWQTRRLKAVIA